MVNKFYIHPCDEGFDPQASSYAFMWGFVSLTVCKANDGSVAWWQVGWGINCVPIGPEDHVSLEGEYIYEPLGTCWECVLNPKSEMNGLLTSTQTIGSRRSGKIPVI